MKPNDVVTVYGNPLKLEHPIGVVKLIKLISKYDTLEYWEVEYTDTKVRVKLFIRKDGTDKS